MQIAKLFSIAAAIGLVAASPLVSRDDKCQCAVCDVGPGDCKGKDLDAYHACTKITLGECGRSCMSLAPGTGAQDGCLAAEITIQKPCENKCVQDRLRSQLKKGQ